MQEGASERVVSGLDRPLRLWLDAERFYFLSGDPSDLEDRAGMQTLHEVPRDGVAEDADALVTDLLRSGSPTAMIYGSTRSTRSSR